MQDLYSYPCLNAEFSERHNSPLISLSLHSLHSMSVMFPQNFRNSKKTVMFTERHTEWYTTTRHQVLLEFRFFGFYIINVFVVLLC